MELIENIYALLAIILLMLVLLALLVAGFLPSERRKQLLQRLRRLQF